MTPPDNTHAVQLYNEGLRNAKAGNFDEAIPLLERSIEADPSRVDSYNVLGKVFFKIGQTRKARKCWKHAIELDPSNATALACLNASGPARWLYKAIVPALFILLALVLVWAFRSTRPYHPTGQMGPSIAPPPPSDHPLSSIEGLSVEDSIHSVQTDTASSGSFPQKPLQISQRPSEQEVTVYSSQTDTLFVRSPSGQSTQMPSQPTLKSVQPPAAQIEQQPPVRTMQQVQQRYKAALLAYKKKQFNTAIQAFRAVLNTPFPHSLKDNAQYWIGECYYTQGNYGEALTEFKQVPLLYPKGNKVVHAQIKMAYCYAHLGQREQARALLIQLERKHPQDPVVRRARITIGQAR